MTRRSRYVLLVDNVSSVTRSRDIEKELEFAGRIRDVVRDPKARCALVEYEKAADAEYAWKKMDNFKMDGRRWKVEYATKDDFKFFGWKWFENSPSPSPSRSRSRSPSNSMSRSASPACKSRTPPKTPYNKEDKRDQSSSPRDKNKSRAASEEAR